MNYPMTFTVDGFAGAGNVLAANVLSNIASFEYNNNTRLLKLTDLNGKVIDISVSDEATWTVTLVSNRITTVVIAN